MYATTSSKRLIILSHEARSFSFTRADLGRQKCDANIVNKNFQKFREIIRKHWDGQFAIVSVSLRGKNHGAQLIKIFKPNPFNSVQTHFFAYVKTKPL